MKKLLFTTWLTLLTIGVLFPNLYGDLLSRLVHGLRFGAVSFPTSLDTFENPGVTQSVATVVTHSTHHANANDALEALEAKVGIGASTPVADTIFGGSSTGVSGWFTWSTTTRLTATNLLATGSSTFQTLTLTNGTSTQATTTDLHISNKLNFNGVSSATWSGFCTTITGGSGLCDGSDSVGSANWYATSTATSTATMTGYQLATTTALTSGQTIIVWANFVGDDNQYCNDRTYGLYIKPASSATSTISLGKCRTNTTDVYVMTPLNGLYVVAATENHEIYIGNDALSKRKLNTGFANIIWRVLDP